MSKRTDEWSRSLIRINKKLKETKKAVEMYHKDELKKNNVICILNGLISFIRFEDAILKSYESTFK